MAAPLHGKIGLALGSGAARGWAHVGVVRGLREAGIEPDLVCGSSIGAVVGAAYAAQLFDEFERWVRRLDWRQIVGYFDLSLRGGLIKARRVFTTLAEAMPDRAIEDLPVPFAAVATDLATGREVWLREGSLHDALRASVALPGLVTPARRDGRWLVDGGLVNPVPISVCRALGADSVIAVDLNTALVGRRLRPHRPVDATRATGERGFQTAVQEMIAEVRARLARGDDGAEEKEDVPSIYEVITSSINVMQERISRSRMAGDPPEMLIAPRLADFSLLDFDRAGEAIEEGVAAAKRARPVLEHLLGA